MNIEDLMDLACKIFGVSKTLLKNKSRIRSVIYAKKAIISALHGLGYKITEIANILDLNHATVIHHLDAIDGKLKYDKEFRIGYERINKIINNE